MHKNFAVKVKNGDLQAILRQKSQYMEKICVMFFFEGAHITHL